MIILRGPKVPRGPRLDLSDGFGDGSGREGSDLGPAGHACSISFGERNGGKHGEGQSTGGGYGMGNGEGSWG